MQDLLSLVDMKPTKTQNDSVMGILIMVDISGTHLNIGDKVAVQYQQLFRIGVIKGFTKRKVLVGFDFHADPHPDNDLEIAALNPWKLAKVANQDVGLQDYYQYIKA